LELIGFIIAFILSYYSDKQQKRRSYIYFLFSLLFLSILSLAFIQQKTYWIIAVGIFIVINTISLPLRLAITLDAKKVDLRFWKVREFFLNLGRFCTLTISIILFYYQKYWIVFLLFAMMAFVYPFLMRYKLRDMK